MPKSVNPTPQQAGRPSAVAGCILYAEDEGDDIFFLEYALQTAASPYKLQAVPDGQTAIEYLAGEGVFADRARYPVPALILLDINMPKKNGLEALKWIRQQRRFKTLPVLMLTSSTRSEDMDKARELGADDYLSKPSDPLKLVELVKAFHDRWLSAPAAASRSIAKASRPAVAKAIDVGRGSA